MNMKTNIEVSNDLSKPLKEVNVEWNLYLFQKRYKQKLLNEYEIYKIASIPLHTIYSDIHKYILKKYINDLELSDYSAEMPKNKIGFIALNNKDNILKKCLFSIKDKHLFENFETFANYSSVWPKAAKFETFSLENIEKFIQFSADKKTEILKNFNIKTDANGAILTDSPDNNEKALKFICGKYLTDFNNSAYEVTYPQRINPQ